MLGLRMSMRLLDKRLLASSTSCTRWMDYLKQRR